MRIKDLITEDLGFSHRKSGPLSGAYAFPGMPASNPYKAYRFAMGYSGNTINFNFGIIINVEHPTPSSLQTPPIHPPQKASAAQSQQDPQYVPQLILVQLSQRKDGVQGIDQEAA